MGRWGAERFFDIQSPYQRLSCCCGAAEELWGVFSARGTAGQCHPHSRARSAVIPSAAAGKSSRLCSTEQSFPGLSPQQSSPQEPLGTSWKHGNEQLSMPKESTVLGVFPRWSQLVVGRFCRCSRSLRSRFHKWSLPSLSLGVFLPCPVDGDAIDSERSHFCLQPFSLCLNTHPWGLLNSSSSPPVRHVLQHAA